MADEKPTAEEMAPEADAGDGDADAGDASEAATAPTHPKSGDDLIDEICATFPACGWDNSRGQRVVIVPPEQYPLLAEWLRDERGFAMCVDVCAVDYLDHWDRALGTYEGGIERFEVVANLLDMDTPRRVRLRVPVNEDDPHCPTLAYIYPSADAAEREVYDLVGIIFDGHPDLTRILMPDDWEGHPLRKDYPKSHIPITFKDDDKKPEDVVRIPLEAKIGAPATNEASDTPADTDGDTDDSSGGDA